MSEQCYLAVHWIPEQLEYSQVPSAVDNLILSCDRNHLSL